MIYAINGVHWILFLHSHAHTHKLTLGSGTARFGNIKPVKYGGASKAEKIGTKR